MPTLLPPKPALAPPTPQQLTELKRRLQTCIFLEHACALAGIPKRVLSEWILQGRAGNPAFLPFVEMIDLQLAELSETLQSPIIEAARDGNIQASMWLFNQRVKPFEDHAIKRRLQQEDEIEDRSRVIEAHAEMSEGDDLAAKLLAEMSEVEPANSEKH